MNTELGILEKDGIYFTEVSDFAKKNLYYLHWGATYTCNKSYEVSRNYLDSCILFYIKEGSLEFDYRGQHFVAQKDQVVLLNCKYANHYYAHDKVEFMWFHFSGSATEEYLDLLYESRGPSFSTESSLQVNIYVKELLKILKEGVPSEHISSFYIHGILSHLVSQNRKTRKNATIRNACQFLDNHYQDSIQVDALAKQFNLSKFHFSRIFKKEVGTSPHQYLLNRRLLSAKQLLANSDHTIEGIAIECGFSSTSHFIRAFKNATDLTPKQFRKMPF